MCKQNGYFPVVDQENFTDLWAFCVLRLAIRHNNSGDPDNILYDQPLGWWDSDWPGACIDKGVCQRPPDSHLTSADKAGKIAPRMHTSESDAPGPQSGQHLQAS